MRSAAAHCRLLGVLKVTMDDRDLTQQALEKSKSPGLSKVLFRVNETDGSVNVETLWAIPLGEDRYQLDNSPFYAYSASWKDIVYAPFDPLERFAVFQRVLRKLGHRTIRMVFEKAATESGASERVLEGLVSLGCSYEGATKTYVCVDIPPGVGLEKVRQFMIQNSLQFEHADPTYIELFPVK
jgi:hypothetical protein